MSHSYSYVPPPDIDYRRAAAIVAGVHALIIFLAKIGVKRYDPVGTFLVGATLVRPECWRAYSALGGHRVRVVGPTLDYELGGSGVDVLDIKECHRGEVVIYRDGDPLCEGSCFSLYSEPLALTEGVFCVLVCLRGQEESGPELVGGGYSLGGSEWPQHGFLLIEASNHPATQVIVKLNPDVAALNARTTTGNFPGYCQ